MKEIIMKQKFNVTGMTCSACSARVDKSVNKLNGIKSVSVNLLTNSMQVEYDENELSEQDIIQTVVKAGYGASLAEESMAGTGSLQGGGVRYEQIQGNQMESGQMKSGQMQSGQMQNGQMQNQYAAGRVSMNSGQAAQEAIYADFKRRLIVSILFMIPLMYVSMGHMVGLKLPAFLSGHENAVAFAFTQFLLCLPVLYVNRVYFIRGFRSLFHRAPNMDSLIAVGSFAALAYGIFAIYRMAYGMGHGDMELVKRYYHDLYFESSVMILTLITVGKYLEARSKGKTSEALNKLLDLAPKTALVERNGEEQEIPASEVIVSDIVIIKPGSSIPVDGIVVEGASSVDESAITGESIPVLKEAGEHVIAATINKTGYMKIQATKVGNETMFSKIVKLVEEASASKAPIAKIADKISGIFVPIVMLIAVVTFLGWILSGATFEFALSCGICVLVISCPCALGLATPVAIMVGTGKGAENGILIKSGEALEVAHNIDCVVLDKTGTITEGKPVVTDFIPVGISENELKEIAYSLESKSEHPLASAVISYISAESQTDKIKMEFDSFESVLGKGITAKKGEEQYFAGNLAYMQEMNIAGHLDSRLLQTIDTLAEDGKTPLLFARNNELIGIIAVADTLKPTSQLAICKLKSMGIKVIMLTGDNQKTAQGIGKNLKLDEIIAEVLPQDKEAVVSKIQAEGNVVAMVGDGINDAPALVRANVGVAISNGTDIAVESADIILMKNDLMDLVSAIKLSKAVIRNIKQNLFWAFFYNALGIPLAAGLFYHSFGIKLNPMFGAAAMSFSSIFVVTNALRLKYFKPVVAEITEKAAQNELQNDLNQHSNKSNNEKEKTNMVTLKVEGMMCMHCVSHVEEALNKLEGVSAKANLETKEVTVEISQNLDVEILVGAVKEAGYEAVVV